MTHWMEPSPTWNPNVSHRHLVALHRVDLRDRRVRSALPTLLVLAECANHATGLSCPTEARMASRGIPYKTWWRHIQVLVEAGLIEQVEKGRHGTAAEYRLLYAEGEVLAGETPTQNRVEEPTQDLGRGLVPETKSPGWRRDLTTEEDDAWHELGLFQRLSPEEQDAMKREWPAFRSSPELVRLCLAIAARGAERELVKRLTGHAKGRHSYDGAHELLPVALARARRLARDYGVDTSVDPDAPVTTRQAGHASSVLVPGADLADGLAAVLPALGFTRGIDDARGGLG